MDLFGLGLAGASLALLWRKSKGRSVIEPALPPREWPLPQEPGWTQIAAPGLKVDVDLPQLKDFETEGLLGEGGMSLVFRARCRVTGKTVALKVIKPEFAHMAEFSERFLREIQIATALRHENLVELYGSGEEPGNLFFAMEWVEGASLEALLKQSWLEFSEFQRLAPQMLAGLQYAHSQQMYHRDVKPANYLIRKDGVCKLLDFGLAVAEGQSRFTANGYCMGTPSYMAPEVLLKGTYGAASDQYALGVVFYEMLTRQCPFQSSDPMKLGIMHVKQAVPSMAAIRPDIPSAWQEIVERMLHKEPGRRFPALDEIAASL